MKNINLKGKYIVSQEAFEGLQVEIEKLKEEINQIQLQPRERIQYDKNDTIPVKEAIQTSKGLKLAKLNLLEEKLNLSVIIAPNTESKGVDLGDVVTLHYIFDKENIEVEIAGDYDSCVNDDVTKGYKLNLASPIVKEIYGEEVGYVFTLSAGKEEHLIRITNIQKQKKQVR